jgi:Kinesin motor domain
MSSIPSYLYSGLDSDTFKLSKELENLGGGDAKTEHIRVHGVFVLPLEETDALVLGKKRVLWDYGQSVGLRDIFKPESSSAAESMRYFPVSSTHYLDNIVGGREPRDARQSQDQSSSFSKELSVEHELKRVVNDVLDGFNHCIMTYGEKGSGKTLALFGDETVSSADPHTGHNSHMCLNSHTRQAGMVDKVLRYLFDSINNNNNKNSGGGSDKRSAVTVAVSAWIIRGQHTIE